MTDVPEMVERVARALSRLYTGNANEEHFDTLLQARREGRNKLLVMVCEERLAQARAAIEAMREPTEAMVEFGDDVRSNAEDDRENSTGGIYTAMIDAALGNQQSDS